MTGVRSFATKVGDFTQSAREGGYEGQAGPEGTDQPFEGDYSVAD